MNTFLALVICWLNLTIGGWQYPTTGKGANYLMPDAANSNTSVELAYGPVGGVRPRLLVHERRETISNFVRLHRTWHRQVTAFMVGFLDEGDVFVDVGANIGYFSVYAGLCVGKSGKVHAVEPDEDNALLLEANLALNNITGVEVHRVAVSDEAGQGTLYRGNFNAGAHSLLAKPDLKAGVQVRVTNLDELLRGEATPKLIKIDVQGLELRVLGGMTELLSRSGRQPYILMELSPVDLALSGRLDDFFAFVDANNYALRAFIANERKSTMPPQIRGITLRQMSRDLIDADDSAEFDLLLCPRK